ncbi:MAG: hypothetical protein AAF799_45795 [Myxococcota bacterium]
MTDDRTTKAQDHLFFGGWKTSETKRHTTITANTLAKPKMFRLSCTELVDQDIVQFRIMVDGKQIEAPLNEGGSVFVEGTSIHVEQLGPGENFQGGWEVVREDPCEYEQATWVAYPQAGAESMVAAFATEQEFVLTLNPQSTGCEDGAMRVAIDGHEVQGPNGEAMQFLEGSSVIGSGKSVAVLVSGSGSAKAKFVGSIKIRRG